MSPAASPAARSPGAAWARLLCMGAVALTMGGCASMSEKECLSANWQEQGYRDGRNGHPASRVEDHREACAGVGVVPDTEQYRKGRDQGVLEYCTPENAAREGRAGRSYRNACPAWLEGTFLTYHRLGYQAYQAQQRLDSLNRQMEQTQRNLDQEKKEDKRRELREELRSLDRRLYQARQELRDAERRLNSKSY